MEHVARYYHSLFYERADPRVKDWLLMTSPWPLATIIASYLLLIKLVLPAYMKDRKAYQLRTFIKWYNIMQIIVNSVVTWGILTSGWTTTYHFGCVMPDYSMNPEPLRMLRFLWWTVILKLAELIETILFLLRKKERQVSYLHIHHHISSSIMMWIGVKYFGGGMASFTPMLNNAVHVVMYSYYLLSSEGSPGVKSFLLKYKKWLTVIQMVQFTVMIIHASQVYLPGCGIPMGITLLYFPNIIIIYYLFYNFYQKNYVNKRKQSTNGSGVTNGVSNGAKKSKLNKSNKC